MEELAHLADESFCYLTTLGRVSGQPHTIEIWFGLSDKTVYMLSGGRDRSDWVKNVVADPRVLIRIGDREFEAVARLVEDPGEDAQARGLLVEKYRPAYSGDLTNWGKNSLPIAVDL